MPSPKQDKPDACTVIVDLEEKNWYKVHAGTYVQGTEASAECSFGLRNATGNAEQVDFSAEYGSQNSNQFSLTYTQPHVARVAGRPLTVRVALGAACSNSRGALSHPRGAPK